MFKHSLNYIRRHKLLIPLVLAAFFFHMLMVFPSGTWMCLAGKCGFYFWGAHGHDGIWHLALSGVSFKQFPFLTPTYTGGYLYSYNFLLDLGISVLAWLGIPAIFSYFKLLPIVWFVLFTCLSVAFARKIKDSLSFVFFLLFFFFFGGSFGYLISLKNHGTLLNSEGLMAMQSGHTMINVQFGFSLVVLLAVLYLMVDRKITIGKSVLLGLLAFIALGLKFYGGVITGFLIFIYFCAYGLLRENRKQGLVSLAVLAFSGLVSLFVFYNPLASLKTGSILSFSPFALVHSIIEEPELFYMKKMVNARYFLRESGWGPRLIAIELFTTLLFIFFNLGTRFFGLLQWLWKLVKGKASGFEGMVFATIVFATAIAVMFVQKGEWWNTIQFFYYAIFLANIFAAWLAYDWWKRGLVGRIAVIILLVLTVPVNADLVKNFSGMPPSYVSEGEVKALEFLKKQPAGGVLVMPSTKEIRDRYQAPYPLFAYDDTSYVAAFSGKQVYLSDLVQLRLTSIDYAGRLEAWNKRDCRVLKEVRYAYEPHAIPFMQDFQSCGVRYRPLFSNDEATVYSITK